MVNIDVFICSHAGYTRLAYVCLQLVEFLPADFQLCHHGRRRQIGEGDGAGKTKLLNAPFLDKVRVNWLKELGLERALRILDFNLVKCLDNVYSSLQCPSDS